MILVTGRGIEAEHAAVAKALALYGRPVRQAVAQAQRAEIVLGELAGERMKVALSLNDTWNIM